MLAGIIRIQFPHFPALLYRFVVAASCVEVVGQDVVNRDGQRIAKHTGLCVGCCQRRKIIYKRTYGTANLQLSVPITPASVFNIGSIAKQFTAMSILLLAQQGRLSLDDDVRKYFPEVPDLGSTITLRHLLHHTSGLRDFLEMLEMKGWRTGGDVITESDILEMVSRQRTLNHKPGEEFLYTNTGYVLLAVVVKRVTGQTLREFAESKIFGPLAMTNTRFYDDHRTIIKGFLDGYLPMKGGFVKWMPIADYIGSSTSLRQSKTWRSGIRISTTKRSGAQP